MKRLLPLCTFAAIAFALAMPATAGDKKKEGGGPPQPERGPEHKVLESLVGVFDAKVRLFVDPKAPAQESKGVMTRKMILGGNFLQESYKGEFFGKPFTGLGIVGFDGNQ